MRMPLYNDVRIATIVFLTRFSFRQSETLEYFKMPMVERQIKTLNGLRNEEKILEREDFVHLTLCWEVTDR